MCGCKKTVPNSELLRILGINYTTYQFEDNSETAIVKIQRQKTYTSIKTPFGRNYIFKNNVVYAIIEKKELPRFTPIFENGSRLFLEVNAYLDQEDNLVKEF